jgi:hypothetical protein
MDFRPRLCKRPGQQSPRSWVRVEGAVTRLVLTTTRATLHRQVVDAKSLHSSLAAEYMSSSDAEEAGRRFRALGMPWFGHELAKQARRLEQSGAMAGFMAGVAPWDERP